MRSLADLMNLEGRVALITGGAGYIGRAACEALRELGADVSILDLDPQFLSDQMDDSSHHGRILPVKCDLKDEAATRLAVQEVIGEFDRLDIIVHCAAYVGTTQVPGWSVAFEEQSTAAWPDALKVNLTSAFVIVQEAREALARFSVGSVILFGSTYGICGPDMRIYEGTDMGNPAGYAASKGGVIQLARYLSTTLAPEIRVNSITPGGVLRGQPEVFQQRYVSRTPMKRMAIEEDLKGAVAYLSGDISGYVTGHNLVVDGGWTAW